MYFLTISKTFCFKIENRRMTQVALKYLKAFISPKKDMRKSCRSVFQKAIRKGRMCDVWLCARRSDESQSCRGVVLRFGKQNYKQTLRACLDERGGLS